VRLEAHKASKKALAIPVAHIEKDRTGVLAGQSIPSPTFDSLARPLLARIMHLAIIPAAIVSFWPVLVGALHGKLSGSCAERPAQLPTPLFSPLSAHPPRRQPPGLLALACFLTRA
jgi:hypothetical protein